MKKIKKFKIKQNSNNEYSSYHYFIPKSEHIKFADARTLDTEIGDLRNQINELEEKTQYLIDKAPLIGFEEGESSLNLRGCANDEIRKAGIDGQSEQKSYEGYNKFNYTKIIETTTYGITCTLEKPNKLVFNGTAAGNVYFGLYPNIEGERLILPSGTYFFKETFENMPSGVECVPAIRGTQNINIYNNSSFTFNDGDYIFCFLYIPSGTVCNNMKLQIQINSGSKELPYEPYTGEQASPNPEYPQDIEVIDGVNKFKNNPSTLTQNGLTMTNDTKKIVISGTENDGQYPSFSFYADGSVRCYEWWATNSTIKNDKGFFTELNKKYLVSIYTDCNDYEITLGMETKVNQISNHISGNKTIIINTGDERLNFVSIGASPNSTMNNMFKIQIVEGTTEKPYLPYGYIGLKQNGKNLLKNTILLTSTTKNGVTITYTNGYFILNGTPTQNTYFDIANDYKYGSYNLKNIESEVKQQTINNYTLSATITNGKLYLGHNTTNGFWSIMVYNGQTYDNAILKIQLEENSTATPYEPYHEPKLYPINLNGNSLAKTGDVKDLLKIYRNGNVEIEKKIGKVVLDETKNWSLTEGTNRYSFWIRNNTLENCLLAKHKKICNFFNYDSKSYFTANIPSLCENDATSTISNFMFIFNTNGEQGTSVEEWKSWLSEHNLEAYHQLAKSETIQLPSIEPIALCEGTNNFELITNLDTTMRMIYKKDIDALIADSGV